MQNDTLAHELAVPDFDNGIKQLEFYQKWLDDFADGPRIKAALNAIGIEAESFALFDLNPFEEDMYAYSIGFTDNRWATFVWDGRGISDLEFRERLDLDYPPMAPALREFLRERRKRRV